jgi:hypothetical protein
MGEALKVNWKVGPGKHCTSELKRGDKLLKKKYLDSNIRFNLLIYWYFFTSMLKNQLFLTSCLVLYFPIHVGLSLCCCTFGNGVQMWIEKHTQIFHQHETLPNHIHFRTIPSFSLKFLVKIKSQYHIYLYDALPDETPVMNRQHNAQKKKYKRTNNDQQNIHIKLKIE